MATAGVQRPPQRAAESYGDYIPDDFADFGELFSDDEQAGPGSKSASAKAQQGKDDGTAGLGIDKEVSVTKRPRDPRVKLDESRLLSAKGIPALRKQARVLKLKGKGHEFSDASRLLSMYQLWLDDLFPKARFGDALAMVEKEGHKTSMHKMRMEWINESKPRDPEDDLDDETVPPPTGQAEEPLQQQHEEQTRPSSTNAEGPDSVPDDLFDDILYDATAPTSTAGPQSRNTGNADMGEVPDESELDALMADAMEIHGPEEYLPPPRRVPEDDFGDLDALIAEAEAAT